MNQQVEKQILVEIQQLPESLKAEVLHFIGFLKQTYQSKKETSPIQKGGFGNSKGRYVLSTDFDAPLEDFKEYM